MENVQKVTWFGQEVTNSAEVPFGSIGAMLPHFERRAFGVNPYLDMIIRSPFRNDGRFVPVGSVSPSYVLVQQKELVAALGNAVEQTGFAPDELPCRLSLSPYGERMHLEVRIPSFDFNPGDGHDLALTAICINSVDKSCALEIMLRWKRLVCGNGVVYDESSYLRRTHSVQWLTVDSITNYLTAQFDAAPGHLSVYKDWKATLIANVQIQEWVDEVVRNAWGIHAAARIYHICRTGYDGRLQDRIENVLPHEKKVTSDLKVPGACAPVKNVFHLSQALSWFASHRNTIEDRLIKTRDIYTLINPLTN